MNDLLQELSWQDSINQSPYEIDGFGKTVKSKKG
jgi:hypothetical protein